jgi:hypothetical protein
MSKTKMINNLLNFGINLDLDSEEECFFYAQCFADWIAGQENYDANMTSDTEVEVYFHTEMVIMVIIENSTLVLDPASDSCFEAVLAILRFVTERHDDIKKEFIKLNNNSIGDDESHSDTGDVEEDNSEEESEWI